MLPADFIPVSPFDRGAHAGPADAAAHFAMTVNAPVTITAERRF
jgi:hypothetical protein